MGEFRTKRLVEATSRQFTRAFATKLDATRPLISRHCQDDMPRVVTML